MRCMSPDVAQSYLFQGGGVRPLRPRTSDINLFCYCERVIDLDPEVSDGTLNLRVTQ